MGFHPERLTGARKRKYDRSVSWTPTIPTPKKFPPYITLKHPEHLKAFIRVGDGHNGYHYLAVLRQSVVLLNHDVQAMFDGMAALGGHEAWSCNCRDVLDKFVTFKNKNDYAKRKDGSLRKWSEGVSGMHNTLLELSNKMKIPNTDCYRTAQTKRGERYVARVYNNRWKPTKPFEKELRKRLMLNEFLEDSVKSKAGGVLLKFVFPTFTKIDINAVFENHQNIDMWKDNTEFNLRFCPYTWLTRIYRHPSYQQMVRKRIYFPIARFRVFDRDAVIYLKFIKKANELSSYSGSSIGKHLAVQTYPPDAAVIAPTCVKDITDTDWTTLQVIERKSRVCSNNNGLAADGKVYDDEYPQEEEI